MLLQNTILENIYLQLASDLGYSIDAGTIDNVADVTTDNLGIMHVRVLLNKFGSAGSWNSIRFSVRTRPNGNTVSYKLRDMGMCIECSSILFVNGISKDIQNWR